MDITERREMEHRLHQQQEFARRLVDNFPDLILVLDADSHYTFISPRCRELLGYSLEEAQYMEFGDRKSTRLNSSHSQISYAVFCLKTKKETSATRYARAHVASMSQ